MSPCGSWKETKECAEIFNIFLRLGKNEKVFAEILFFFVRHGKIKKGFAKSIGICLRLEKRKKKTQRVPDKKRFLVYLFGFCP